MVKSLSFLILTITSLLLPFASGQTSDSDSGAEVVSYSGFTVSTYSNYKVVKNEVTQESYCLVQDNSDHSGCSGATVITTPATAIGVYDDNVDVIPFLELLGKANIAAVTSQNVTTSSCVQNSSGAAATMTFSTKQKTDVYAKFVSFSGSDDQFTPLEKAAWIFYVAAFFDDETVKNAFSIFNNIESNYNCHRENLANPPNRPSIVWTKLDAVNRVFTIHTDPYFTQLSQDGAVQLSGPNRAQDPTYAISDSVQMHIFANTLSSNDARIIDTSLPNVTYDNWVSQSTFFKPNKILNVSAINNGEFYSINGLQNSAGQSDWAQRSAARPDLALLDLVHLVYPDYSVPSGYPIWLESFESSTVPRSLSGACTNVTESIALSSCTIQPYFHTTVDTTTTLTVPEKAGVSVGTILFVIILVIGGIWFYRRYRRKTRHNFYRMNDL
ncbi:hypothetical protein K501DRAFT_335412 [Backusella circina FSU 941]|nr:hypothetical protein K501DRAFT_335412 [Backusella circina FSU 941]